MRQRIISTFPDWVQVGVELYIVFGTEKRISNVIKIGTVTKITPKRTKLDATGRVGIDANMYAHRVTLATDEAANEWLRQKEEATKLAEINNTPTTEMAGEFRVDTYPDGRVHFHNGTQCVRWNPASPTNTHNLDLGRDTLTGVSDIQAFAALLEFAAGYLR